MLTIHDQFVSASLAKKMRAQFDERFGDPLRADSRRFVWDYWNVPGQYNLLRTVPGRIFARAEWRQFTETLVSWGRENLGCHAISEPWLSCYVEGNEQGFHGDRPHGPFAFVWSLTPWKARRFSGGETLLLRPEILNYWNQSGTTFAAGMNDAEILTRVPPVFNRLTVFDPRIPHAVSQVRGVNDVCAGRLVVHGWFVQPRPFIQGPVSRSEVARLIETLGRECGDWRGAAQGHLIWRLTLLPSGKISGLKCLVDTLQGDPAAADQIKRVLIEHLLKARFRKQVKGSRITLPILFDAT